MDKPILKVKEITMTFFLLPQTIDALFLEHKHQSEILIALYKIVYDGSAPDRPDWDTIATVDGWPKINEKTSKYIAQKFVHFDSLHHQGECIPGGLWLNNGFSIDEILQDWECRPAPVKLLKEA